MVIIMTRKERLWAALRGKPVDRIPFCFYEINGLDENPQDMDPFNIYTDDSWKEMIALTKNHTDRIVSRFISFDKQEDEIEKLTTTTTWYDENGSFHEKKEIQADDRILTQHTRKDLDINTIWTLEHFLKDEEDLQAYLRLPHDFNVGIPDIDTVLIAEEELGDTGIIMIEIGDPLLELASLFSMEDYTITAMLEQEIFKQGLDLMKKIVEGKARKLAQLLPERLWRIYGPEYATPPFLPPYLYKEYVVDYDRDLIDIIKMSNGVARVHQHGNLSGVLNHVKELGCQGLDPIEPSPQGDVTLQEVRQALGDGFVLFGNLEINDIEMLEPKEIEEKVKVALSQGPDQNGSSFILMPSASPYGRKLPVHTLNNYKKIVEIMEHMGKQ